VHGAALLLLLVYGSARAMRDRMGWHVLTAVRGLIMNCGAQVENPIPFLEPGAARLTTGYLHARRGPSARYTDLLLGACARC